MARPKGQPKLGGRAKGVPNKLTVAAKEAFALAFQGMGGVPALSKWAEDHPTEFYKLYARLIPVDVTSGEKPIESQTVMIGGRVITF